MNDPVLKRLKRIRGQVEGIIKMYEQERECVDIVTQVSAVRSALSGVGKELLSGEAVKCSRNKDKDQLDKLLKQLFDLS